MTGARDPADTCSVERYVHVPGAELYACTLGAGDPVIVIHGGPGSVDHTYLRPSMDALATTCALTYYDQRGHGRSRGALGADDVTVERYVADLGDVRDDVADGSAPTLLGHSWGAFLAMRFAIRHPDRISRLVLMNACPASKADFDSFIAFRRQRAGVLIDEQRALQSTTAFEEGDPALAADLVRRTFSVGIHSPIDVARLRLRFTRENVVRGRTVAARFEETLFSRPFDLLPDLARVDVPTLVLHGAHDFVPVSAAERIAAALPEARLVVIPECGHFAYLEATDVVRQEFGAFLAA